jgi:hypothetical protein
MSGLENREHDSGDPLRWPRNTLYPQKLALTSPISGGRSVGIVRLRTKPTELLLLPKMGSATTKKEDYLKQVFIKICHVFFNLSIYLSIYLSISLPVTLQPLLTLTAFLVS